MSDQKLELTIKANRGACTRFIDLSSLIIGPNEAINLMRFDKRCLENHDANAAAHTRARAHV